MLDALASHLDAIAALAPMWGYAFIFLFMAVESSFIPFPSEIVMIPAGFLAARGELSLHAAVPDLALAVLVGLLGSLAGAYVNYFLSASLGEPFLRRYGRWFFLKPAALDRASELFNRYGAAATFICRLLPAIRQLISIPAGIAKMPLGSFTLFTALGAGLWTALLAGTGFWFGRTAGDITYAELVHRGKDFVDANFVWLVLAVVLVVAVHFLVSRFVMKTERKGWKSTVGRKIMMMAACICLAALGWAKPLLVGLSDACPGEENGRNVRVRANYAEALAKGGHLPVVIPRFGSDDQFDALVARLDVLILTGGEDVAPSRYGETPHPKLGGVNAVRDDFEFRLLAAARRRRLPVLGICRGCQLLNVAFGGTLWQDLPSEFPAENVQHLGVRHPISILPDARLAHVLGVTNTVVNSSHHQAVKAVAPGFRIVALSPEGVPEAIESADYPAVGVQFHPEALACEGNDTFATMFRNLLELFRP